jgi:hypothetical protein
MLFRASPNDTGVAFIQQGGQRGQGRGGHGKGAGRGSIPASSGANADRGRGTSDVSTITGASRIDTPKTNSRGEFHCYNCGAADHWAYECPHLSSKQQQQLHMNLDAQDQMEEVQGEGHQLLNVTFVQGAALPENRAYLDGCLTVMAFKTDKYLKEIKTSLNTMIINCNAGAVNTNQMGC